MAGGGARKGRAGHAWPAAAEQGCSALPGAALQRGGSGWRLAVGNAERQLGQHAALPLPGCFRLSDQGVDESLGTLNAMGEILLVGPLYEDDKPGFGVSISGDERAVVITHADGE